MTEAEDLVARYGITLDPHEIREVRTEERASEGARFSTFKTLFSGGYLLGSLAIAVSSFMGLLLVFGLNQ